MINKIKSRHVFQRSRPGNSEYFIIDRITDVRRATPFGGDKFRFETCLVEVIVEHTCFPRLLQVTFVHLVNICIYGENLLFKGVFDEHFL